MIWSMSSFQAAILRRPRWLARPLRSPATRLRAILRRRARLRAAVRSRTRLSSSRKVTSRTQCKAFSMLQCRRIARTRTAGSSQQLALSDGRAHEDAAADQAAVTFVEGVEHRPAAGAVAEAGELPAAGVLL